MPFEAAFAENGIHPRPGLRFPWISALSAILTVAGLVLSTQQDLMRFYGIPADAFTDELKLGAAGLFAAILLIDMRLFYRRVNRHRREMDALNNRVDELLLAKKQLQNKAHTFAGNADKLKLFISDRLLEYIEYDEKFLHFKNIASEVRHNGVICFDKVQCALNLAMGKPPEKDHRVYQDALKHMIYLWDLLELSTTDNLALHIANQLCEHEEHYCQLLLKDSSLSPGMSPPTFSPRTAALRALNTCLPNAITPPGNDDEHTDCFRYADSDFWIQLEKTEPMLGKENHIVLLLENMINNALFYAGKKLYNHKHARTAIALLDHQASIRFRVYNHGPHIRDEDKEHIYQLGYSTRRVKNYNGKGLGLYFVNEIIKGYEGKIWHENIFNFEKVFSIRIAYADGSVVTEIVAMCFEEGRLKCKGGNTSKLSRNMEWTAKSTVRNVEISLPESQQTFSFDDFPRQNNQFPDPGDPAIPRWLVSVIQRKHSSKVSFSPLDVNGVCFYIDLPSARSRLDYSASDDIQTLEDQELDLLRAGFREPDKLVG